MDSCTCSSGSLNPGTPGGHQSLARGETCVVFRNESSRHSRIEQSSRVGSSRVESSLGSDRVWTRVESRVESGLESSRVSTRGESRSNLGSRIASHASPRSCCRSSPCSPAQLGMGSLAATGDLPETTGNPLPEITGNHREFTGNLPEISKPWIPCTWNLREIYVKLPNGLRELPETQWTFR